MIAQHPSQSMTRALPSLTALRIEDVLSARPLPIDPLCRPVTSVWGKDAGLVLWSVSRAV